MADNIREVVEGRQYQGVDEEIPYPVDTTGFGGTPTSIAVVVKDITSGLSSATVVTSTVMPTNSPSVAGNIITLSPLKLLTAEHLYRVEVKFTSSGNILEAYFEVQAQE